MTHPAATPRPSWARDEFPLPPPHRTRRPDVTLAPRDLLRLELNAALTAAGIAPMPGDREAIEHLSALPHTVHTALQRWLTHTSP